MSATLDQVQTALKVAAATITALDARATEPVSMGGKPVCYPRLVPTTAEFDVDMSGGCRYSFDVWVIVAMGDRDFNRAQTVLNPFLSPTGTNSLKAAIEADVSLAAVVNHVRVTGISNYGTTAFEGAGQHLAGSVRVEVYT